MQRQIWSGNIQKSHASEGRARVLCWERLRSSEEQSSMMPAPPFSRFLLLRDKQCVPELTKSGLFILPYFFFNDSTYVPVSSLTQCWIVVHTVAPCAPFSI